MENFQVRTKTELESIDKLINLLIIIILFVTPLFFLALTPNFFEFNKMYLVLGVSSLVLILLIAKNIFTKQANVYSTPIDLPVFLFLAAILVSTFLAGTNRVLPFSGRTGLIIALTCFYFALTQAEIKNLRSWLQALMASSFILSWITIFAYVQLLAKILPWDFAKSQLFSPAGSLLVATCFQVLVLPITVLFGIKSKQFLNKILYFLIAALSLVAIILAVFLMLPGKPAQPTFLGYSIGWWIAVEIFKNAKSALIGVGPERFLTAFSRFRPAVYNTGNLWNIRFTASSNEYLHILTTLGLFGFTTFVYLLFKGGKTLLKNLKKDDFNLGLKIVLGLLVLQFLLIPANFLNLFILYLLLAVIAKQFATRKSFGSNQIIKVVNGTAAILIIVLLFLAGRIWAAERNFKLAIDAATANKGLDAYNRTIDAIKLNPFQEKYHVSHAQVNLALANSLAAKKDLSDTDRQNITQLVSQAISEAKGATALDPDNPTYWENLANIYRSLINFAAGTQDWATASYVQAIRSDPTNPALRLQLGGLFYALKNWDSALDQFKWAIDLKPDFANAYYNLSWAYRQKQDARAAYQAMQRVLALVPQDTQDFTKATLEMEELKKLLPPEETSATQAAQKKEKILTPPPTLPSPMPAGPINLPEKAAPEIPSPVPSPTPSPIATPSPQL